MVLSAYVNAKYSKFNEVITFFAQNVFMSSVDEAKDFLHSLCDHLTDTEAACDKVILNSFIYGRKFRLDFILKGVKVGYIAFDINRHNMIKITSEKYEIEQYKKELQESVKDYIEMYNDDLLYCKIKECNLKRNESNKIVITKYDDYKPTETTKTLEGTLDEIFDTYTSMNDTLRYCNGEYWRFEDKKVTELYGLFTSMQKDYFLNNAVKRGCIID